MIQMLSDEEAGLQILDVFRYNKTPANGMLPRNYFFAVRDSDFQRGMNRAIAKKWITRHLRNRYQYILTEAGFAAYRSHVPA